MINKQYYNIKEVSKMLDIKEHVIRHWDSIDPKTKKLRIEGLSMRSKGGTRYFNKENISKLEKLKNLLYENGLQNHSLKIANRLLLSSKRNAYNLKNIDIKKDHLQDEKVEKIRKILTKMRLLTK